MKRKIVVTHGLISGALIVGSWFITLGLNDNPDFSGGEVVGYAIMLVALTAIFIGLKKIRDEKGSLSFKEGFVNGLGMTLVASTIYVIGWMVYAPTFAPDFADKYAEAQIELVQKSDLAVAEKQQQIDELKEWIETYKQPHVMAAVTFVEIFPVGLVVSLISALLLKRK